MPLGSDANRPQRIKAQCHTALVIIASVFVSEHGSPVTLDMLESPRIERSAGRAMVVIRRQGNATGAVQVDFATRAGSALEDVD